MRQWLVEYLICPASGQELVISEISTEENGDVIEGTLATKDGSIKYPIIRGVPRFVENHYAAGFGLQWNTHKSTQIDNIQTKHSEERFWGETGFKPEDIKDKLVLDGGCGAGRFAEVVSRAGGRVIGVDLSEAVDAAYGTLKDRENICIVQANLFEMPLKKGIFDFVYTIGVIQHTPDPLRALACVAEMGKLDGARAGISWYKKYWYTYLHQKYWLRPFFKNWDEKKLYSFVKWYSPKMLSVSRLLCHIPGFRPLSDRILPVANRDSIEGLSKEEKLEWSILDTFDWYNPAYDKPQTWQNVISTMESCGYQVERAPLRRAGLMGIRKAVR